MLGIKDFGLYLPYYYLKRRTIGEAWAMQQERPLLIGARTVANYDEDCATMAVEAVFNCLAMRSTTLPLAEKSTAALVTAACDLSAVTRSADFGASLRAGTTALQAAFDAVQSGSARNVVVVAADQRQAQPGPDWGQWLANNLQHLRATAQTSQADLGAGR